MTDPTGVGAPPRITVAICTRNRAAQLSRVLDTARRMRVPAGLSWELLIVDNGSTDATAETARSFAPALPVRCVVETTPGLSNARNRAVAEARGDYICWTDDDVEIDEGWLAAYAEAFDRHPDAVFFGGVIEPKLLGDPPAWMGRARAELGPLLAERDFGPDPVPLSLVGNRMPFGANFAVRTREQRAHRYDPRLGRAPGQARLGEETLVMEAMAQAGGTGWWVPGARVRHLIPAERQTLGYVYEYHFFAGATVAFKSHAGLMGTGLPNSGRTLMSGPLYLWRHSARYWLAHLRDRLFASDRQRVHSLSEYAHYRGALDYWQGVNRASSAPRAA